MHRKNKKDLNQIQELSYDEYNEQSDIFESSTSVNKKTNRKKRTKSPVRLQTDKDIHDILDKESEFEYKTSVIAGKYKQTGDRQKRSLNTGYAGYTKKNKNNRELKEGLTITESIQRRLTSIENRNPKSIKKLQRNKESLDLLDSLESEESLESKKSQRFKQKSKGTKTYIQKTRLIKSSKNINKPNSNYISKSNTRHNNKELDIELKTPVYTNKQVDQKDEEEAIKRETTKSVKKEIISSIKSSASIKTKPDVFLLKSKDFVNNGVLPERYFCDRVIPIYPSLHWEGRVLNTKSFTLSFYSVDDLDEKPVVYFIIYNIPVTVFNLDSYNFQDIGIFGLNSKGTTSYMIPCKGKQSYVFTLCALSINNILAVSNKEEIDLNELNRICSEYKVFVSVLTAKSP